MGVPAGVAIHSRRRGNNYYIARVNREYEYSDGVTRGTVAYLDVALTLAPWSNNNFTMSAYPPDAASISGVESPDMDRTQL